MRRKRSLQFANCGRPRLSALPLPALHYHWNEPLLRNRTTPSLLETFPVWSPARLEQIGFELLSDTVATKSQVPPKGTTGAITYLADAMHNGAACTKKTAQPRSTVAGLVRIVRPRNFNAQ